jgi:hypothetical protein
MVAALLMPMQASAQAQFVSPFKRQETPPPAVAGFLSDDGTRALACQPGGTASPAVSLAAASLEVATVAPLCLEGFTPGQDITLQVTPPGGPLRTAIVTASDAGTAELPWLAAPEDPTGTYSVAASQGAAAATAEFSVAPATSPHLSLFPPAGTPGTAFRLVQVGSVVGKTLYLYRRDDNGWRYASEIPPWDAVHTDADDPVGVYLLRSDLAQGPATVFELRNNPTAISDKATGALKRREVPPGLTSAQLYFGQGAGSAPPCKVKEDADQARRPLPASQQTQCTIEMGAALTLQFVGFVPNQDLTVRITEPDGRLQTLSVRPDLEDSHLYIRDPSLSSRSTDMRNYDADTAPDGGTRPEWWATGIGPIIDFDPLPGHAFGDYRVDVTQGSFHGTGTFTVNPASEPHMRVLAGRTLPGDTIRMILTGFAANQRIPVNLYAGPGDMAAANSTPFGAYLTTLLTSPTDQYGNVLYELKTEPDDVPGYYVVQNGAEHSFYASRSFTLGKDPRWFQEPDEHFQHLAYATIGESNHTWSSVIARDAAPVSALERFYGRDWLTEVRGSVARVRASGGYRTAHLTALTVNSVNLLPDGRWEASATETWDDHQFAADGALIRDLSGTLDQRYVFERVDDRWLIVDSQIIRR